MSAPAIPTVSSSSSAAAPTPTIAALPSLVSSLPPSNPLSLSSSTVLVTGSSGFVGRWLIRSLLPPSLAISCIRCVLRSADAERTVRAVYADAVQQQKALAPDAALAELEIVRAELEEESKLKEAMKGVRHVFHVAARTDDWDPQGLSEKVNVDGTKTLLRAAKAAGVRRFVHCGTEAVLVGSGPIINADESRPVIPASSTFPYSRSKALAELAVLSASDPDSASVSESGFTTVSIRPRFVWGAGDTNVLSRLCEMVRKDEWVWISGGNTLTSSCHVRNLCEAMLLGAQVGRAGQAYFVTDGAPQSGKSFLTAQFAAVGTQAKERSVPYWLVYAAATLSEKWCGIFGGKPPITRQAIVLIGEEVTVKDDKARKELGYKGSVSIEEGLKELKEHFEKYHTVKDY